MKKIRAFIAIPLPDQVQRLLGNITHAWSKQIPEQSVRWVKPQLMHITLRFLGVTDSRIIPSLIQVLDNVTAEREFFTLRLDKPGCFPNIKRPRVIWVGLQGQLSAVQLLKKAVDEAVVPLGWEIENRSFRPHLTIGRVKDSRKVRGHRWEAEIQPLSVPVRKIHLIESRLQQDGPIYTIRHESFLRDR